MSETQSGDLVVGPCDNCGVPDDTCERGAATDEGPWCCKGCSHSTVRHVA
jgi:hypothetical protein